MCLMHPSICPAYAGDICAQKVICPVVIGSKSVPILQLPAFRAGLLSLKRDITKETGCKVDI